MSDDERPIGKAVTIFAGGLMCLIIGFICKAIGNHYISEAFILLGIYAGYRGIVELTTTCQGFQMPNAWKIIVSFMCLVTLINVANVYVMAGFWTNFGVSFADNVTAIVDGIIKLIEYFKPNSVELFV